jgi:hypothetical protein
METRWGSRLYHRLRVHPPACASLAKQHHATYQRVAPCHLQLAVRTFARLLVPSVGDALFSGGKCRHQTTIRFSPPSAHLSSRANYTRRATPVVHACVFPSTFSPDKVTPAYLERHKDIHSTRSVPTRNSAVAPTPHPAAPCNTTTTGFQRGSPRPQVVSTDARVPGWGRRTSGLLAC